MRRYSTFLVSGVATALTGLAMGSNCWAAESAQAFGDELDTTCGPAPAGHPTKGRRDYRLMNLNAKDARDLIYHETYHIVPATRQLRSGADINWRVMNNLHFVLHKVPNDARALGLLIEWDLAGGRDSEYSEPKCYLTWARQFAPDDTTVWNYGGFYFYRKGDLERAEAWWVEALKLDPGNAEAHYNLALLLLDKKRYAEAREHAWAAYAAGHPLPGLRNRLEKAGQWREPPPDFAWQPAT